MIIEAQEPMDGKDKHADDIIQQTMWALTTVGLVNPVPLADAPAIVGAWGSMLTRLATCYGVQFDLDGFFLLMKQMPITVSAYVFGVGAFCTILQWTGLAAIPAGMVNGALNGGFTYCLGKLYKQAFRENRIPSSSEVYGALRHAKPKSK